MNTIATQQYIDEQLNYNLSLENSIEDIKKELIKLNQELRKGNALKTAQETAQLELMNWLKQGEELIKDCSGVFPQTFLHDVVNHVQEIADRVEQDFQVLSSSGRFFSTPEEVETEQIPMATIATYEEVKSLPAKEEVSLPSEDDDVNLLDGEQIYYLISNLPEMVVSGLKKWYDLNKNMTNHKTISQRISEKEVTHKFLSDLIKMLKGE